MGLGKRRTSLLSRQRLALLQQCCVCCCQWS